MRPRLVAWLLAVCAALCAPPHSLAQSPQARREELAKVQEMLSDPDPLMRLANMETIINSGDGLKKMLAIRTGFASDDADLRSLALQASLAGRKELTFDVLLPPALQKQVEAASNPTALTELEIKYPFLKPLRNAAFRFQLKIVEYQSGNNAGTVSALASERPFAISGDKWSANVDLRQFFGIYCYVDFGPGPKQTFLGALSCQGGWPRLEISAPAF